jgi:hypothetical protein
MKNLNLDFWRLIITSLLVIYAAWLVQKPKIISLDYDLQKTPASDEKSAYHLLWIVANSFVAQGNLSTTRIPISAPSPVIKNILNGEWSKLPNDVHGLLTKSLVHSKSSASSLTTVRVQSIRNIMARSRFEQVQQYCFKVKQCQEIVNLADEEFGMTPLHLLSLMGDPATSQFLIDYYKADSESWDKFNRQPRNLSFENFVSNSKRWAKLRGDDCQLPVVDFTGVQDAEHLQKQFGEVKRLMYEGEPMLMRGIVKHLSPDLLNLNLGELIEKDLSHKVKVGEVPYASYFGLDVTRMSLHDYYTQYVMQAKKLDHVLYVFEKSKAVTEPGLKTLTRLWHRVFDDVSPRLICPVDDGMNGAEDSIHFFLGAPGSGAPTHIHADAWNVLVKGRKHWYMHPPRQALYSKKHIVDWIKTDLPRMQHVQSDAGEAMRAARVMSDIGGNVIGTPPLECVQEAGDIAYVPFDWGHAVYNEHVDGHDVNFGYALELLNRREVMSRVTGRDCE